MAKDMHVSAPPPVAVSFTLNGRAVTIATEPDRSLLSVLREEFGITSPKNGCEPMGQCGCCTVLIDGEPRLSCALKIGHAQGWKIQTLEGVAAEIRDQLAASFQQAGGCQCGFCIPGIALRAVALVREDPRPTRARI